MCLKHAILFASKLHPLGPEMVGRSVLQHSTVAYAQAQIQLRICHKICKIAVMLHVSHCAGTMLLHPHSL